MKSKYIKENFIEVIKKSNTLSDVRKFLGLGRTGASNSTIKKYIKLYNISISHFNYEHKIKNEISLSSILISGSTINTSSIKEKLYKTNFKKRECEICGQGERWRDMTISLILDHKNGNNKDNRIENLRILCPNCNAGQDTFCRGLKKRKKKIIRKFNSDLYNKIYLNQKKIKDRPPLEQLQKETSTIGFLATGRKYQVSDNTIRKWIKRYIDLNEHYHIV